MRKKEIVAMILAGGQGSRLGVLTKKLAKPAVPYGGKYRIIILVNTLEKEERISLSNIEGRVVDLLDINKDYILINKNIDILISAHKFIILKVL